MTDHAPLPAGSTIGILGGGQLGRMLSLAASRLGFKTRIYCPDPASPAFDVTPSSIVAGYEDEAALEGFARLVDVVTYEFENVPLSTAEMVARHAPLRPGARALEVSQDRLTEKAFLTDAGIAVAPYRAVADREELEDALEDIGYPAVLKTTRLGYDGKGQRTIRTQEDAASAFEAIGGVQLVLEAFVPFAKEISVIAARSLSGEAVCYDPAENTHENHILKTSRVPADIDGPALKAAIKAAGTIVEALDYVGVMGIEFFVLADGGLLVNEIAPRVHNSGHWTEAVCVTDQFENHIRAIAGWPLGTTLRMADVVMENLIGDEIEDLAGRINGGTRPHSYGKAEARPGRKMGHLNHVALRADGK
ncbi:5-(carboxyamino)imidazole ribonucleotide synthase [Pelagibacterium montanilacus]|uniref:5-(carboxyamino)imidazole ribonucleotide synthase n=1 Tax=Pelagibacterium montanilacus TaxID=2185280 RepID=UPI000F8E5FE0|nr:5-(carboxyamino)imidazole ribonucleotide synthase [Pelagibacterium montanilacus]